MDDDLLAFEREIAALTEHEDAPPKKKAKKTSRSENKKSSTATTSGTSSRATASPPTKFKPLKKLSKQASASSSVRVNDVLLGLKTTTSSPPQTAHRPPARAQPLRIPVKVPSRAIPLGPVRHTTPLAPVKLRAAVPMPVPAMNRPVYTQRIQTTASGGIPMLGGPAFMPPHIAVPVPTIPAMQMQAMYNPMQHFQMMALPTAVPYVMPTKKQKKQKGKKKKIPKDANPLTVLAAAGDTWVDDTLADWPINDFRIFCGDLGNEVTDEMLKKVFSKYPTFSKAKIVREKKTGKTKGYGFVSFMDPADFARAMKEVNGKYVGNRPIKLRKSKWKDRLAKKSLKRK